MSKRIQVVVPDEELEQLQQVARREGLTLSEWVRQALRRARSERPTGDRMRKLAAVRAASRHSFPTGDIDEMLADIERGYAE